ncbi:MAG: hypothetical protein M0R76_04765 [Proteobacteria bacterium]|nr:hypothetical protein [Pseudomonadota bacterium]
MSGNYYDVVVIGMDIAPLCAGALLARRGFRVLVAGQHTPPDTYTCQGYRFMRQPPFFSGAHSPVVRRICEELTLTQPFERLLGQETPRLQVVTPQRRVDVHAEVAKTVRELSREMPAAERDAIAPALKEIGHLSREFEKIIASDLVIPPESFFERRDWVRAEVQNPFFNMPNVDLFSALPLSDALRSWLQMLPRALSGPGDAPSALRQSRQIGALLFDAVSLPGGHDALRALFCEKIAALGGDVQPAVSVKSLDVQRGRVQAVRLAGREEPIPCHSVVSGLRLSELSALVAPSHWTSRFRAQIEDDTPATRWRGYVLNLGVDAQVVPEGMGSDVLFDTGSDGDVRFLQVSRIPGQPDGRAALQVTCVLDDASTSRLTSGAVRDAILDHLRWLVPFLDNHLHVIHSPNDGLPPICLGREAPEDTAQTCAAPAVPWWRQRPEPAGVLGISALPYRTGIKGLLLCGEQVIAGLQLEGEFISAWGVARIISKADPSRRLLMRTLRTPVTY